MEMNIPPPKRLGCCNNLLVASFNITTKLWELRSFEVVSLNLLGLVGNTEICYIGII